MRKLLPIMLSVIVLLCWSKAAGAAWVYYATDSDKSTFYYERESIKTTGKGKKTIWIKKIYDSNLQKERERDESIIGEFKHLTHEVMQYMFDCPSEKIKLISYTYYSKDKLLYSSDDNPQDSVNQQDSFASVKPESLGKALYEIVCK
jgi:hypothetical protein